MEDTTMKKREYIKPSVQTTELHMHTTILVGSKDEYGMNNYLNETEEVDEGF